MRGPVPRSISPLAVPARQEAGVGGRGLGWRQIAGFASALGRELVLT